MPETRWCINRKSQHVTACCTVMYLRYGLPRVSASVTGGCNYSRYRVCTWRRTSRKPAVQDIAKTRFASTHGPALPPPDPESPRPTPMQNTAYRGRTADLPTTLDTRGTEPDRTLLYGVEAAVSWSRIQSLLQIAQRPTTSAHNTVTTRLVRELWESTIWSATPTSQGLEP